MPRPVFFVLGRVRRFSLRKSLLGLRFAWLEQNQLDVQQCMTQGRKPGFFFAGGNCPCPVSLETHLSGCVRREACRPEARASCSQLSFFSCPKHLEGPRSGSGAESGVRFPVPTAARPIFDPKATTCNSSPCGLRK